MDRRKKKDIWSIALICLNILTGIVLVFILLFFHFAQPEFETLFDRFYQLNIRTDWDIQYLYYLKYLIVLVVFICFTGLLLGIFRGRRKNDHKNALIIIGIIACSALVVLMIVL